MATKTKKRKCVTTVFDKLSDNDKNVVVGITSRTEKMPSKMLCTGC